MIITLDQIRELTALATSAHEAPIEVDNQAVINTTFYKEVQQEIELSASSLSEASPEIIILIAKIAATSPKLESCDFCFNSLMSNGPRVAAALAKSATIKTVYMAWNSLGTHAPAVAAELANSNSINMIYMAAANDLNEKLKESVTSIFTDHNRTVDTARHDTAIASLLLENNYFSFPTPLQDIVVDYLGNTPAQYIEWDHS